MAEFTSAADAPAARAVIYSMGFDHDMVQHALAQAGGNEQLAINLILNGEVHGALTASSSAASIAAAAVSFSGPASGFGSAFAPSAFGPPPQSFAAPALPSFAAATPIPANPFPRNPFGSSATATATCFGSSATAAAAPSDILSAAQAGDLPAVLRFIAADAACIEKRDTSPFG
jgi:hypothetical protein